jgi:hypothetical protein
MSSVRSAEDGGGVRPPYITREEHQAQWDNNWPDIHPEDYCQRCLNRNFVWFVDSDRFNAAAEALGFRSTSILCPACFVEGHEKATGLVVLWKLIPGAHFGRPKPESGQQQMEAV